MNPIKLSPHEFLEKEKTMNILIEKNVMVPMRDGVKLATDVYRPAGDGCTR